MITVLFFKGVGSVFYKRTNHLMREMKVFEGQLKLKIVLINIINLRLSSKAVQLFEK